MESAKVKFMELFTECTTLRVDDHTGLSLVASAPALELQTLGWLKISIAELFSGVRVGSNPGC